MKNFLLLVCLGLAIGCHAIQPDKNNKAKGNLDVLGLDVDRFCKEVGKDRRKRAVMNESSGKLGSQVVRKILGSKWYLFWTLLI